MGGTEQMDANIGTYRIGIHRKKGWWPIFTWLIDTAIHNAWLLMRSIGNTIPQLNFRREVAQIYLTSYQCIPKGPGRPSTSKTGGRVISDTRYDRKDHLLEPVPGKKRRRCAMESCFSVGRTQCNKCDVGICVACFVSYHTK